MSLDAMVWVLRNSESTLGARLVLLVLAEYAHDDGMWAFPEVATIANKARMSRKGVQEALRRLERDGHIEQTGTRPSGTRVYRIVGIIEGSGGVVTSPRGGEEAAAGGVVTSPDPSGSVKEFTEVVVDAWNSHAPPLMEHRSSYFVTPHVKTAIRMAMRTYPAQVVSEAIDNYAAVLGGNEYLWSYRWTLEHFLRRGLDRFVPEARPLENFLSRKSGPSDSDVGAVDDL